MNIETTAFNLKSALSALSGAVERRNTIPVLGTVKVSDGKLSATNLDMEVAVVIQTIGKAEGAAAIDFFRLSALAKHIPADETVSISEDDHLAAVKFNGSEYRLPSCPASNYPEFGQVAGERTIADNIGIVAALRRVRFAISTEEVRYYLNGVALVEKDGIAYAAATDGRRLSILALPVMPAGAAGSIIHRETVNYLCARKGEPKAVTFQTDKPRALFEYDGLTLSAKLIDGKFPEIWRVIPQNTVPHLTCNRERLLVVLRRIAAFVPDQGRVVKITGSDGGVLSLSARTGVTSADEHIVGVECLPFEAGYNVRYLIEALTALNGETVTLAAQVGQISGSPATLTSDGDDLKIVIMPMRV
jgi:DNA polymerase-3 subunit beta